MAKKVLFVVAHQGYQPVEYDVPKKLLEYAGFSVITASNKAGTATASDDTTTTVDILLSDVNAADYDGIFFVGGPGAIENLDNETSYNLLVQAARLQKTVGAICISTRILAKAGILQDKRATGWNGDGELVGIYKEHDVLYVANDIVVDGSIITAVGPDAAREYAERIISLLQE